MTHHYSIDALDQHLRAMDPDQLNKITAVAMQLSDRLRAQAGSPHPDERRRVWRDVNEIRADKPFLVRTRNGTVFGILGRLDWLELPIPGSSMRTYQPVPAQLSVIASRRMDPSDTESDRRDFGALVLAVARLVAEGGVQASEGAVPVIAEFESGDVCYSYAYEIPCAGLSWLPRERGYKL